VGADEEVCEARVMLVLHACAAVGAPAGAVTPRYGLSALELLLLAGRQRPSPARARLVRALLAAGATPACRQVHAYAGRALDLAGGQADAEVFAALLGAGAALQPIALRGPAAHQDISITWPLLAAFRGSVDVLRLALAAGLCPNVTNCDFDGASLLCLALSFRRYEFVRVLLEEGGAALELNAVYPSFFVEDAAHQTTHTVAMAGMGVGGRELLVHESAAPVYACESTALDCALGRGGGGAAPMWLLEMLRERGARTGAELGARARYCVRGGGGAE
jgi:hypothetical protein